MTIIYLLRHGQYESPNHILPYRLANFHLSQKGIDDVTNVAQKLSSRSIVAVYTSPLERTYETAVILAQSQGLTPIVDERLLEVRSPAQGQKEGFVEAKGGWEIYETTWFKERGGETLAEIASRMKSAMEEFVHLHEGKELIVVSHGDPIMALVALYKGMSLTPESLLASHPYVRMAGGYRLEFEERRKVTVSAL